MKMRSTLELASRYVVPAVRRELAIKLIRRGFTAIEVAKLLGVSPSLISRYLNGERGSYIDLRKYRDVEKQIELLADAVSRGLLGIYKISKEVDRIAMYVMARKYICSLHKKLDPSIDVTRCTICPDLYKQVLNNKA